METLVYLVIGITLGAAGGARAYGWRQEALAQNAQEAASLGHQLYERIATLESRVLVSARRPKDLKAAPEGVEIEAIEPVEGVARKGQAVGEAERWCGPCTEVGGHPNDFPRS